MSIPADAFKYGDVASFEPGQLLRNGEQWFLLTRDVTGTGARYAVALAGPLMGQLVHLNLHDRLFAVSRPFEWRPMLGSAPIAAVARPGSLFFASTGPVFRNYIEGRFYNAYDRSGMNVTNDLGELASVAGWSVGLFANAEAAVPLAELFRVDAAAAPAA